MARAAAIDRPMTIEDFLVFDDGTDTRYELRDGRPVAMAPAATWHGVIAQNVGTLINAALKGRRPCRAVQAGGVVTNAEDGDYLVPDVVMTCEPLANAPYVNEPRLIVEVISPSTGRDDKDVKVPAYAALPTVEEIWLVHSLRRWVLVWRKVEGTWVAALPYVNDGAFESPVLGAKVGLDAVYDLTEVPAVRVGRS